MERLPYSQFRPTNSVFFFIFQVDHLYPSHSKCRLDMSQSSQVKATKEEVDKWKNDLGMMHSKACYKLIYQGN